MRAQTRFSILAIVLVLGLILSGATLWAQTTGTIHGRVIDQSSGVVANAAVEVRNLGTGEVRNSSTGLDGTYLIPALSPGTYRVNVEAPGFKGFAQSGVTLEVNQNARVDVALEVGAVTETVTVEADALKVDTQGSTVGAVVDNRRLRKIPLNGRNILALAQMLPGVGTGSIPTTTPNSRNGATISVSGARDNENNFLLDGTSMVQPWQNKGTPLPNPDALQEFRVITNTSSAEFGRAAGGVFLTVTKSGTNEIHGSAFEFLRNDSLNGRNFFATGGEKPKLSQNQFGFSLGGPIVKNRTFIFGSYGGTRIREQSIGTFFPLSEAERRGDFSHLSKQIIDPDTDLPFENNIIPQSLIDPMAVAFLDLYVELPNQPDGRRVHLRPQPTNGDQLTVKLDHQLGVADRLSVRYFRNKDFKDLQSNFDSERLAGPNTSITSTTSVGETHIFSPSLLNEFRISYMRINPTWAPSPLNKAPRELGGNFDPGGPDPLAPAITVNGRGRFWPQNSFREPDDTGELTNKTSWITGKHTVKFGAEIRLIRHLTRSQPSSGRLTFSGTFSGDQAADLMIGRPSGYFQQGLLEDLSRSGTYYFFAQDDFKVHPRLTLNLGLRYELNTPWIQRDDHQSAFRPGMQSTIFPTAPPGMVFPGDPGVPRGLYPTDKNNFAPRFGLAWDPFGKGRTAIRGGYGIFYSERGAVISSVVNQTAPYIAAVNFEPFSLRDPFRGRVNPFPFVFDPQNPEFPTPQRQFSITPDYAQGYIHQYNLNIQHQFGADLVTQVGYVAHLSRKLSSLVELNNAIWQPGANTRSIQSRRPWFPEYYGPISDVVSAFNSAYHSLQVSVEKRFSHGYTAQLAYSFSRNIDDRPYGGRPQDPMNWKGDRGLADIHQKHILAINGVWELPVLRSRGALTTLFGGWQLAGLVRMGSGLPFSLNSGRDFVFQGTGGQRPDVVGEAVLDPNRPRGEQVAEYFNTAAFVPNGGPPLGLPGREGQFGNAGRNNVVGPGFAQTDLAILKRFPLPKERLGAIEFRAEFFNLFNQVNFQNPNDNLLSPAYGQLTAANDGRVVQFGLRWDF